MMIWDIDNINEIVSSINNMLVQGMTMSDIERKYFDVNPRVIHKRLDRQGYKRIDNQYVYIKKMLVGQGVGHNEGQDCVEDVNSVKLDTIFNSKEVLEKVLKLAGRYDEIIKLLDIMDDSTRPSLNKSIVLELPLEEGKKDFKVTARINKIVWERFNTFCSVNKQYSKKELLSQALVEYINNHKE